MLKSGHQISQNGPSKKSSDERRNSSTAECSPQRSQDGKLNKSVLLITKDSQTEIIIRCKELLQNGGRVSASNLLYQISSQHPAILRYITAGYSNPSQFFLNHSDVFECKYNANSNQFDLISLKQQDTKQSDNSDVPKESSSNESTINRPASHRSLNNTAAEDQDLAQVSRTKSRSENKLTILPSSKPVTDTGTSRKKKSQKKSNKKKTLTKLPDRIYVTAHQKSSSQPAEPLMSPHSSDTGEETPLLHKTGKIVTIYASENGVIADDESGDLVFFKTEACQQRNQVGDVCIYKGQSVWYNAVAGKEGAFYRWIASAVFINSDPVEEQVESGHGEKYTPYSDSSGSNAVSSQHITTKTLDAAPGMEKQQTPRSIKLATEAETQSTECSMYKPQKLARAKSKPLHKNPLAMRSNSETVAWNGCTEPYRTAANLSPQGELDYTHDHDFEEQLQHVGDELKSQDSTEEDTNEYLYDKTTSNLGLSDFLPSSSVKDEESGSRCLLM